MDWITSILIALLGCSSIVSFVLYGKAMRRIKSAEAHKAEADADTAHWERYEKQLDHANATVEKLHTQIDRDAQRIEELRAKLDDKTERIRMLTDTAIESERLLNEANHKITKLTEERDRERMLRELYKQWLCHKDCCDREPPNPKIKGKNFKQQEREITATFK